MIGVLGSLVPAPAAAQPGAGMPGWPEPVAWSAAAGAAPAVRARNPALGAAPLAGPGPGWSLPGLALHVGLDPVSLGDLGRAPDPVPRALRERWLQRIEARGRQRGDAGARLSWGAVAGRGWSVELASAAWLRTRLDSDAAELLLFGNAGRTGEPRPLAPDGSVDAAVLSTLTGAVARPVRAPWPGRTAVGVALAASVGHGVWVARDAGSLATADPPTLTLRFPLLEGPLRAHAGSGAALHVGTAWERGPWSAGLTVQNALARFRWRREGMTMRPGEAVLGPDPPDLDDDPRPLDEAHPALLAALDGVRPAAQLALAAARRLRPELRVAAELRRRAAGGIASGPRNAATVTGEWSVRPSLPLQGAIELGEGMTLGVAAEPRLGGWVLTVGGGAGLLGSRREWTLALGARRAPASSGG